MSIDVQPVTAQPAGCTATWHDTAAAYRKAGCRCPKARTAESARKSKYDARRAPRLDVRRFTSAVIAALPPFRTDPRRHCANLTDPNIMFPERAADVPAAVAICHGCPLKTPCAAWALHTRQPYGVYGGITAVRRRKAIHAQGRRQVSA